MRDFPLGLRVTELGTFGQYTVLRHRGYVVVLGAPRGGEAAVERYLHRIGTARADAVVLTQFPRAVDNGRVARLAASAYVLYVPGPTRPLHGVIMYAAQRYGTEVVFLYEGDALRAGRLVVADGAVWFDGQWVAVQAW